MYEDASTKVRMNGGRVRLSMLKLGCTRVQFSAHCYSLLEAMSGEIRECLPIEPLYADDLVVETKE